MLDKIDHAEAIFFAGGDQSVYLSEWMDTPMQKHIQAAIDRGVPVGGTSAGCDVQGGLIYSAINDSVLSSEGKSSVVSCGDRDAGTDTPESMLMALRAITLSIASGVIRVTAAYVHEQFGLT